MNVDRAGSPPVRAERATPGGEGVAVGVARCAPSERQVRSVGTSLSGVYGLREIQVRGEKKKLGRCAIWVNCKARVMRCRRRQILSFFCESFNWGGWKMWRYGKKSFVKRATYFVVNKWTYECDLWRCYLLSPHEFVWMYAIWSYLCFPENLWNSQAGSWAYQRNWTPLQWGLRLI